MIAVVARMAVMADSISHSHQSCKSNDSFLAIEADFGNSFCNNRV